MSSVGEVLRAERNRRNLELDRVSRELKISRKLLEAIEEDRFDSLPGTLFARSFVRQYAALLELDGEELAARIQQTLGPDALPTRESEGSAAPGRDIRLPRLKGPGTFAHGRRSSWSSSLSALAMVVLVMLLCSGVYAFWQRWRRSNAEAVAVVQAPPARVVPAAAPPVPPAATPPAPNSALNSAPDTAPNPPAGSEISPGPARPGAGNAPDALPSSPPSTAPAASVTAGAAPAEGTGQAPAAPAADVFDPKAPVRVEMTARAPVWVRVASDSKYRFSGTLQPDQTRAVSAGGEVLLRIGSAGDLEIRLNGQPVGPVGPKGQIRTVQFTSGGFKIVPPAPKPAAPPIDPF